MESGEKERLKELLRERLIECGWRDEMKTLCRFFLSSSILPLFIIIRGSQKQKRCYLLVVITGNLQGKREGIMSLWMILYKLLLLREEVGFRINILVKC